MSSESRVRFIVLCSLFTALVFVATAVFPVYIPATHGYFNLGETMVYATALTFGPIVGAVAGGVGSMLADIALGYPFYAPGTLIIKGAEGFIVGLLSGRMVRAAKRTWRTYMSVSGILGGVAVAAIGLQFYHGETVVGPEALSLGGFEVHATLTLWVPSMIWPVVGAIFAATMIYLGSKAEPSWAYVMSAAAGGAVMILGYYLYEVAILTLGVIPLEEPTMTAYVAALFEVPFNVMQMLVGILVGVPVAHRLRRVLPSQPQRARV